LYAIRWTQAGQVLEYDGTGQTRPEVEGPPALRRCGTTPPNDNAPQPAHAELTLKLDKPHSRGRSAAKAGSTFRIL